MKKRLNLKLVLVVVVGLLVVGVGVHFVHRWQVQRTAGMLLTRAEAAREEGDLGEAQDLYRKYLRYRPDDVKASVDLANTMADLLEQQGATADRRLVFAIYGAMENALRKDPDNQQVRRRLTKLVMSLRRFHDAKEHLQYLLEESPSDAELTLDLARCHVALGENTQAVEVLRATLEESPQEVDAYRLLAEVLGNRLGDVEGGREVLNQMVESNEENWRAYLVRATSRLRSGDAEGSRADTERALELAPDEAEVLLLMAEQASRQRDREAALANLQRGLELYPEDERFYQGLANLEHRRGNLKDAVEYLLKGQEVLPQSPRIAWYLADLQLQRKDAEGAAETVARLPELNFNSEMVDLMRARLEMAHGHWAKARGMLERVRPLLARDTNLSLQIELMLGICYAELRQTDLAMQAAERALILDPTSAQARRLKIQQYNAKGNYESALAEIERMFRSNQVDPSMAISAMSLMLRQELLKPAEQRNWQPLETLLAEVEAKTTADIEIQVFRAELLYQKGELAEARALLNEQKEKHPRSVALWLALAGIEERDTQDMARALKVLDDAQDVVGDSARLRIARANLWLRRALRDVAEERDEALAALDELGQGMDSLPEAEQTEVSRRLAQSFYRLGERERAREAFLRVIEASPQDIDARLSLFNLASEESDDAGMQSALEMLAEVEGREGSYWNFGEGVRLYILARQAKDAAERQPLIEQARRHVATVLSERAEWADAVGLDAQLDELAGQLDHAIDKYQQAIELGGRRLQYFRSLSLLLTRRGRYEEADQAMQQMPAGVQEGFGHLPAELARITGDVERAEEIADRNYDADSDNYRDHLFYARVLVHAGKADEAEAVLARALPLAPEAPEVWVSWVANLVRQGKVDEARAATAEARDKVRSDVAPLALGQCYELLRDYEEAERSYQLAVDQSPGDLSLLRVLADYYLRTDQVENAVRQLTRILQTGAEQDPEQSRPMVTWSRRNLARLQAGTGSYREHQQALRLIDANAVGGRLELADLALKGSLLANRPERASRLEAMRLFEQVLEQLPNHPGAQLTLGQLYERDRRWPEARQQFSTLCARHPENALYKVVFIRMLLRHDELSDAARWLETLETLQPDSPLTQDARARILAARGEAPEAIALVEASLPSRPVPPEQLPLLRNVANTLVELADLTEDPAQRQSYYTAAQRHLREFVEASPEQRLVLADFLGRYADVDEAFRLCDESRSAHSPTAVARLGLFVLRNRGEGIRPEHYELVQSWLTEGFEEQPGSSILLLHQADLYDLQGKTSEAEQVYRQLLAKDDLPDPAKATALNNLAFIIAVQGQASSEALQMIEEAIELMGPIGELLDTRAMVRLAQGQTDAAIRDLEDAIAEQPSGMKYFHLAQAHLQNNNQLAAAEALTKAKETGLTPNEIPTLEREKYQQLLNQLGLART